MNGHKEQLSQHIEEIFKSYEQPGLHICDIATGGGKSYTIGKLTCEFYPESFQRIIILCVQNKLVTAMSDDIDRFVSSEKSLLTSEDKLVIENNPEVLRNAVREKSFSELLEQMERTIEEEGRQHDVTPLRYAYNAVKKLYDGVENLINIAEKESNDYIEAQINEGEVGLRRAVRGFFEEMKLHLERTKQVPKATYQTIVKRFPALLKVYPQVGYKDKRVLLMTVHKAIYGIDPILTEMLLLEDLVEKRHKTLVLFDESDQAADAIRAAIIDQSIERKGGGKRFANGYNGFLQYKALIETPEHIANGYYGSLLEKNIIQAKRILRENWAREFAGVEPYKSILLGEEEDIESFRHGVFFSGPAFRLTISSEKDKRNSYICYKEGNRHFSLVHTDDKNRLRKAYAKVVPMGSFLSLVMSNTKAVKSRFREVIVETLENNRKRFNQEVKELNKNGVAVPHHYLGYPTLEREIHTLFSRFETTSEYQYEQQMKEFMTNRKNIATREGDEVINLPDNSVYSQGIQLFQEELDGRDNQHRVRLSCREIASTPEKILIELLHSEHTSVVLCSATASSQSVVSNYDIAYLKDRLGDRMHSLSKADRIKFDELVEKTYPPQHRIEIVPLENCYDAERKNEAITLPEKYRAMFSHKAQEEGLAEKWFEITRQGLGNKEESSNMLFQLSRLYQFIEAYHWFIHHDDVRSMIFFQNRTGDKDRVQFNVLSSLIDGTYPEGFDTELPKDWENKHLRISKDWEEVEKNILTELSESKDAKLMLVTAYGSFKAGTNMQYEIPEGLNYVAGDSWEKAGERHKKDWDAVYLQSPTGYVMLNKEGNETAYERSLYKVMLNLMMLHERGCLSKSDVKRWMGRALLEDFYFSEKGNLGVRKDKAAWAQTVIEQAVGRLCRTRNKPLVTYILFDERIKSIIDQPNLEKSLTKEFKALAQHLIAHPYQPHSVSGDPEESIRYNRADRAQSELKRMHRIALHYLSGYKEYEEFEEEEKDNQGILHKVKTHQLMNQSYKRTIIRKPVIKSPEELDDADRKLTFMSQCYADWQRNDACEIVCYFDKEGNVCPAGKHARKISPAYVRLDALMKNSVIREYFERQGYATSWATDGLILHPHILATDYAGEIGEEAFKALVLYYTHCTETSFKHLEGEHYELADFVVCNPDGSYKIAFDVKNMNLKYKSETEKIAEKRGEKAKRLGCRLITVNLIGLAEIDSSLDSNEISGMMDAQGHIFPTALEILRRLVDEV